MTYRLDPFFTPVTVANELVQCVEQSSPGLILDPAAGDGALVDAAARRWADARVVALDCDPASVRALRKRRGWETGSCDFLSPKSRVASPHARALHGTVDLLLLNPPYSGRGYSRWLSRYEGVDVASGRAMAFVLTALSTVRDGGELVALLPSSALTSQRDEAAWELVRKFARVDVVQQYPRGTFPLGTAATVGIRMTKSMAGSEAREVAAPKQARPIHVVDIVRGVVPVHEAKAAGLSKTAGPGRCAFLHSTDLRSQEIAALRTVPADRFSPRALGPAVLLPRVGKPLAGKIVVWGGGPVVLSDCIFALTAGTLKSARHLAALIRSQFESVADSYVGSCARYLTIAALIDVLARLGVAASWPGPARWRSAPSAWWAE
jgi:predicted RNA methylase